MASERLPRRERAGRHPAHPPAADRPRPDHPYFSLLHVIAELEGCEVEDLPPLYDYVDHLLEDLFTTPPPPKAQARVEEGEVYK